MIRRLAPLAILLAASGAVFAQAPFGSPFQVNTYTAGFQYYPSVAMGSSGFLIVWDGAGTGDADGVFGRRFSSAGSALGSAFLVNTTTTDTQDYGDVAALGSSGFVVTWSSYSGASASWDIRAQRLGTSGEKLGAEFRVNTFTLYAQDLSSVAAAPSGQFMVAWDSLGQDDPNTSSYGVYAQRFSASGSPLGGEVHVSVATAGDQARPAVAADGSGNFLVVWLDTDVSGTNTTVFGRRFASSGSSIGGAFEVSTANGLKDSVDAAFDTNGGFFVVWSGESDIPNSYGIFGRRFASDGTPLTDDEAQLNTNVSGDQDFVHVARTSTSEFVVVWSTATQSGYGFTFAASAQRFSTTSGLPLGGEFLMSTATGDEDRPAIGSDGSGKYVVAWHSGPTYPAIGATDVWAQRFGTFSAGVKGDADGNGTVNVSDVLYLINHLFAGGPAPVGPGDADGNGQLNVSDVLYLINYLFAGGPAPV